MIACPHCGKNFAPAHQPLTRKQATVFAFLERFSRENGFAPTLDEIAHHFHYSSIATVYEHLTNLERKGVLQRDYKSARGITLLLRTDELEMVLPAEPADEEPQ